MSMSTRSRQIRVSLDIAVSESECLFSLMLGVRIIMRAEAVYVIGRALALFASRDWDVPTAPLRQKYHQRERADTAGDLFGVLVRNCAQFGLHAAHESPH